MGVYHQRQAVQPAGQQRRLLSLPPVPGFQQQQGKALGRGARQHKPKQGWFCGK